MTAHRRAAEILRREAEVISFTSAFIDPYARFHRKAKADHDEMLALAEELETDMENVSLPLSGKLPETESTASVIERCAKICEAMSTAWEKDARSTGLDYAQMAASRIRALLPGSGSVARPVSGSNSQSAVVEDGYVRVPIEPTRQLASELCGCHPSRLTEERWFIARRKWNSLVKAAMSSPPPKEEI